MWQDPIVAEVRAARAVYVETFKGDWQAMLKDLQQQDKEHRDRLVSFPPKRVKVSPVRRESSNTS